MIHRILTTVTTLLLLSAVSMWIASYLRPYQIRYHRLNTVLVECNYIQGSFQVYILDPTMFVRGKREPTHNDDGFAHIGLLVGPQGGIRWLFRWNPLACVGARWGVELRVPFWFLSLLFAVYPTVAFIRGPYRRHRRRKKGLCLKCGYDLTGNLSGVCPECGERI